MGLKAKNTLTQRKCKTFNTKKCQSFFKRENAIKCKRGRLGEGYCHHLI